MPPPKRDNNAKPANLIKSLVPDPSQVPELRLVRGWVGVSTSDSLWRIYTHLSLSEYFDVERDQVHYAEAPLAETEPAYIWLVADANVRWTRIGDIGAYAEADDGRAGDDLTVGVEPTQCPRPCRSR